MQPAFTATAQVIMICCINVLRAFFFSLFYYVLVDLQAIFSLTERKLIVCTTLLYIRKNGVI